MKNIFLLLLSILTLASCGSKSGSGNIISETRTVNNFNGISVGGDFEVEVKIGPVTAVVVEADDNILKYIVTEINGSTLKINTEGMHNYDDVHMKVFITTPSLKNIKTSASARVIVDDILANSGTLGFKASSGSSIRAEIDAPQADVDASSGASIKISGKTRSYTAEASSGAEIKSGDLLSEVTTVKASSGASAAVHASVTLNANASSGSSITYYGGATVNQSVSSGSSLNKGN